MDMYGFIWVYMVYMDIWVYMGIYDFTPLLCQIFTVKIVPNFHYFMKNSGIFFQIPLIIKNEWNFFFKSH